MTDPTPATPAASTEVPAAAAPTTPAAVVPPTPETPAAPAPESLIPAADKVTAEVDPPAEPQGDKPAVNQDEPEWLLYDGVKGEGKAPDWYKADKYKTVSEQAKAYAELEKRMGAFTGAPKDGKYEIKLPAELDGTLDVEHPMVKALQTWAAGRQMNQEAFNEAITMLATYEAELAPDPATIKAELGTDADARINAVAAWGKANLALDQFELMRAATAGPNAAAVFKTMEALIAKTRQPRTVRAGTDVPGGQPTGEAAINAAQAKLGPDGKRLFETDPAYRAMVENMRINFYNSQTKAA
jgi:hypothetical protein